MRNREGSIAVDQGGTTVWMRAQSEISKGGDARKKKKKTPKKLGGGFPRCCLCSGAGGAEGWRDEGAGGVGGWRDGGGLGILGRGVDRNGYI